MHVAHDQRDRFLPLVCAVPASGRETVNLKMAPARGKVCRRDLLYLRRIHPKIIEDGSGHVSASVQYIGSRHNLERDGDYEPLSAIAECARVINSPTRIALISMTTRRWRPTGKAESPARVRSRPEAALMVQKAK